MYEVEVKLRAEHGPVRDRLAELDGEPVGHVVQRDTYYDAPHRDFAETDEALRIRREERAGGEETKVTYKGPRFDDTTKTREEHETGVEDGDTAAAILDSLGFEAVETVEKQREYVRVGAYTVTLDSVTGLGEFVEVEREVPEDAVDDAREGAHELVRDLGLDPEEGIRTSYLGLLLTE